MPIYEYRCPNGHTFEVFQRMSDAPVVACENCGAAPVEKILFPVAVHFKGSGFYSTDYGRAGRKGKDGKDGESSSSETKESKSETTSKATDAGTKSDSGTKSSPSD